MGQTIVKGLRYPTSSGAWRGGIQRYDQAKTSLPPAIVQQADADYVISCDFTVDYVLPGERLSAVQGEVHYHVVPHVLLQGGEPCVCYYVAARHRPEYVISPDKLDEFLQNANGYYIKGIERPHIAKFGSPYLSGKHFPVSPKAWEGGVMPYRIAEGQLPSVPNVGGKEYFIWISVPVLGSDGNLINYKTYLVPQIENLPEPVVNHYLHYDPQLRTILFAVSPDHVEELANKFWHYYEIALTFLKAGKDFQAQGLAVEYYALRGKWTEAFRSVGRSWVAALQDPSWWLLYFGLPMLEMLIARGSSAAGKIRGAPDVTGTTEAARAAAARELHAAELLAEQADVTEVHLGEAAKTEYKSPAGEKFPDVVARKKDGTFALAEGKGTDMKKVIDQFASGRNRIGRTVSDQVVVVEKVVPVEVAGGKVYPSPGPGFGMDAQGFLIDLRSSDPASWVRAMVNGQPIKVVLMPK